MGALSDLFGAVQDLRFRSDVGSGLMDALNRGAVGQTFGGPIDLANVLVNLGKAAYGTAGHATGLLSADQMPELEDRPVFGSEWLGQKMQDMGLVSDKRNEIAEGLAGGALAPLGGAALAARAPQIAAAALQAQANLAAPAKLNKEAGVIYHRFLKPSVALGPSPFQGLSGADASAMTRYRRYLDNPDFANRELMREYGNSEYTTTSTGVPQIISPEDMYRRGNPLVPVAGDTSRAGIAYTKVNGVPLDAPVSVQGGFQYPMIHQEVGSGNAWASNQSPARGKQSHFDKVAIDTGLQPRGVFFGMNPTDSIDFSSPVAEMMVGQMKALKPSESAVRTFNSDVQKTFPDFVGMEHPEVLDQLLGRNGFDQEGAGALRKQIAFLAKKKSYENMGFPSYDDISAAVNHPLLRNSRVGDSGLSTFLGMPGEDLSTSSLHNSYGRGILGQYDGSLPVSIPGEHIFPDMYDSAGLRKNTAGSYLSHDERMGVLKMGHDYQIPDQKWLDQIMPVYEQKLKQASDTGSLLSGSP